MANIAFLTVAFSIFAVVINLIGLIIALAANSKFHGGTNKLFVRAVLVLVVILNIHLVISTANNTFSFFYGRQGLHILLDHISFILVILIGIFTAIASIINFIMAKEQGFRV